MFYVRGVGTADALLQHELTMRARWLGHGTMVLITLHGWGFWALWLWQGGFARALTWDPYGTNMLAGAISWLCGAILWVTATAYFRRKYFEVWQPPAVCTPSSMCAHMHAVLVAGHICSAADIVCAHIYPQVFKRTHILGFLGFIIFGYMHYTSLWAFVTPGALGPPESWQYLCLCCAQSCR